MEKIKNPDLSKIQDYKVLEAPELHKGEKETTFQVDKGEKEINFCSKIGSHIRAVLTSPNEDIEVTRVHVDGEKIHQLTAKIPLDSLTISVKKSPKKAGSMSRIMHS